MHMLTRQFGYDMQANCCITMCLSIIFSLYSEHYGIIITLKVTLQHLLFMYVCNNVHNNNLQKPSRFACFTQVHTNACNFLADAPFYTCFTMKIVQSFGIYCVKYGTVIGSHYKITTLYTSKNGPKFSR